MKLIANTEAQAGGLFTLIAGIFIVGFFLVAFGAIMQQFWSVNNDVIAADSFHYSQDHWNAMDLLFKYWWALPVYSILIFVIFIIKNALTKQAGEV